MPSGIPARLIVFICGWLPGTLILVAMISIGDDDKRQQRDWVVQVKTLLEASKQMNYFILFLPCLQGLEMLGIRRSHDDVGRRLWGTYIG